MSIGRTDFERGSYEQIIHSLQQVLAKLPGETKVYPGHGPATTIAEEIKYNPYFMGY
jgi:glyoxylase-like metal-dependent hydrolase (beta-lactamase superfamily II)